MALWQEEIRFLFGELTNEGKRESLDGIKFLAKNCIHPHNSSNLLVSI